MLDNSATSNIVLPQDLQNAIDNARVNLSLLESKSTVLMATNTGLLKDNATLVKRQEYLTSQVEELQANIEKYSGILSELHTQTDSLSSSNTALNIDIESKKEAQIVLENDYNKRIEDLKTAQDNLDASNQQLTEREQTLESDITNFNLKVSKLKEVLDTF